MRLVFLHAFPLDQQMWNKQLVVAPGRCLTPKLYGLGPSLGDWATNTLKMAGASPVVIVGASMGGACAIEMAKQAPDQVAALVLVGTKAGHRPEPQLRDNYIDKLRADGIEGLWPTIQHSFGPQIPNSVADEIKIIAHAQSDSDLVIGVEVFHSRPDLTEVLCLWRKPLLVVCGERDPLVSYAKSLALSRLIQHSKLHVMSGCGHYMNMERPAEFNQVVGEFVQSVEAGLFA